MNKAALTALAIKHLTEYMKRQVTEKDLEARYDTLGADSVDMVTLAFEFEKATGVAISPEIFFQYDSFNEALDAIADGRGDEIV